MVIRSDRKGSQVAKNGQKQQKMGDMAGCGWNWLEMLCAGQKQSGVVSNGHQKWLKGVTGGQKWPKIAENG